MNRQKEMENVLTKEFAPQHLELVNESHMHSVPPNSETHFKLTLVADKFEGLNKVKRHQLVYQQMNAFMSAGLHALALHTYSPNEWKETNPTVPDSPNCMGGSKGEQA